MLRVERFPDFVLPTTLSNRYGHEIDRLTLQRDMFQQFCPTARIWVICPRQDTAGVKDVLGVGGMYTYLEDEELLTSRHVWGWFNQQIIKIAMARLVGTAFFVTLDSDVFPARELVVTDFVRNDKGVFGYTRPHHYSTMWNTETAQFMGTEPLPQYWSITPLVYSAEGWGEILKMFGDRWQEKLAASFLWKENTLYQYGLHMLGLTEKYHEQTSHELARFVPSMLALKREFFQNPSVPIPMICLNSNTGVYPGYIRAFLVNEGILT